MPPEQTPSIVVVGSHAPAIFVRVHRPPKPGETVIGWDFQEPVDGGKGSNQAIAAAKLGVSTSFVDSVGNDRLGREAREWMSAAGVDLRYLYQSPARSTGVGFILLDDDGVPAMVTTLGANADLDESHVEQALAGLAGARVMLTQFEIRPEVALQAAAQARQRSMLAIVIPAPACRVPLPSLAVADILTPNETEAKVLLGYEPDKIMDHTVLAEELRAQTGVGCVIITLGENGIVGVDEAGRWRVRPPRVEVIDTSGAGDAFCAALAAGMVQNNALLGGESSGGLTIRGHIPGKDGIFASALIVEMLAVTGKHVSELQEVVFGITGRLYSVEDNLPATADMRIVVPQRVKAMIAGGNAPYPVVKVTEHDGTKVYFEHDNWALLRFSGTEPVLRIFAEADTPEKARELVDWLKSYAQSGVSVGSRTTRRDAV